MNDRKLPSEVIWTAHDTVNVLREWREREMVHMKTIRGMVFLVETHGGFADNKFGQITVTQPDPDGGKSRHLLLPADMSVEACKAAILLWL